MASDYTWITDPPIRHVAPEHVAEVVRRFRASLASWGLVPGATPLTQRINSHAHGASFIADLIVAQLERHRPVFEYHLGGQTVALLQLDLDGGVIEIKNLATHPGAEEAGGIMVEYALNRIAHYNAQGAEFDEGRLYLESYNADSTAAYEALDFVVDSGDEMSLDANASGKWVKIHGAWKLASKFAEGRTKYLSKDA